MGSIGLTQVTDFATLAFGLRFAVTANGGYLDGPDAPDPAATVTLKYLGNRDDYEIQLPHHIPPGSLAPTSQSARFTQTFLNGPMPPRVDIAMYRPGTGNPELALSYTSLGIWEGETFDAAARPALTVGVFAYGVPSAPGGVPMSGQATYEAVAYGKTPRADFAGANGKASAVFDFASQTVSGDFDLGLIDWGGGYGSLGRYTLASASFSPDRTSFSGRFVLPGGAVDGMFEGRLTGPQAQELMVRWQVPFTNPRTLARETAFGVWIGRRI